MPGAAIFFNQPAWRLRRARQNKTRFFANWLSLGGRDWQRTNRDLIGVRGGALLIAKQSSLPWRTHFFCFYLMIAHHWSTPRSALAFCVCSIKKLAAERDWLIGISAGRPTSIPICFIAFKYLPIWGRINHAENKSSGVRDNLGWNSLFGDHLLTD